MKSMHWKCEMQFDCIERKRRLNTCMRVWRGIGSWVCFSLFMVGACYWRGRLCFGRGRNRCFVLYNSIFLRVLLDVSPGVGRTPGEPEEPRSTKAQYTCRPYSCTQQVCLYIFCTAGFDDLGQLLFSFNMSFLFRKVEYVTTIRKSQSLTSVSIKDCTLRVPNKTTTLFLYEQ